MSEQRPAPTSATVPVRGLTLHYWDWAPRRSPALATVVFAHATGFHGRLWDAVIARLSPSWRCVALDLRGHGRSEAPDPDDGNPYAWREFTADTVALMEALDLRGALGVAHSMGGFVMATSAARAASRFVGLVLADPVITDTQDARRRDRLALARSIGGSGQMGVDIAAGARKRRPVWPSAEAMIESLAGRPPFDTWLRLACPPAVEAATFAATNGTDPWPDLPRLGMPVTVMRGLATHGLPSTTSARAVGAIPHGRDMPVADCNHFIPMERPDLVADAIGQLARRLGLAF
jgi:lipase